MKLAFYTGVQKMPKGLGNLAIQIRLDSKISHCEVIFEPGDGVDEFMPDKTLEPIGNAYWCASSSATDKIHHTSPRRAGKTGGVRLKRIDTSDRSKWLIVDCPQVSPQKAIEAFKKIEGAMYDWQLIVGFLAWPIRNKDDRYACHEAVAILIGLSDGHRLDPPSLYHVSLSLETAGRYAVLNYIGNTNTALSRG